jgi:hypothetical protein
MKMKATVAIQVAKALNELLPDLSRSFGFIEDSKAITLNGRPGFIIWDWIVWNELTFVTDDGKVFQSLYTSLSDRKTRAKFDEYVNSSE